MLAFAFLGLLGVGLIFSLFDDDDDANEKQADESASGDDGDEIIETGSGDDTIFANGGDDIVLSSAGDDRVFGGDGEDIIIGGADDDFIRGGAGGDYLTADGGNDTLFGDAGNDLLDGTDYTDNEGFVRAVLEKDGALTDEEAAAFNDLDNETGEADTLDGGVGNDAIFAGNNDVVITGSGFDDVVLGDWMDPNGGAVEITDFDPARDIIVYLNEEGTSEPNIFFGENDDGTATLEQTLSNNETVVLATLSGVDFFDLSATNNLVFGTVTT